MINKEKVYTAIYRAYSLTDYNNYNDTSKEYESRKQIILSDESLTEIEKSDAIKLVNKAYDNEKIRKNKGTKRTCENCNQECLATLFCEYCVRNYLRANFSNWTSGNDDIDKLIQECQMKALDPDSIVEWIPHNNLKNVEYLTKGGFSEIYVAEWINGNYEEWDSEEQQLKRLGTRDVILKKLENVENVNQSWFEEVCNLKIFKFFI
jgi:hypothetical protein